MEIMTTTAVYHNKEMDLSGGNNSFWEDNEEDEYVDHTPKMTTIPKSLKILSAVIFSLVFVLGVSGNGVVIWLTGFKMKKTVETIWYLNLAVADFIVTAFLPLSITGTALDNHWPFGRFMCKMNTTVFVLNMFASILTLVVISVDRCVCVVFPGWAQNHRSVRKASWVSLGVWVLALAPSSLVFIFRDTKPFGNDNFRCYYNFAPTGNYSTVEVRRLRDIRSGAMLITRFLMGFVVPFTVIVSCYSVIIYRFRNNRSLASQSGRSFKIMAAVIATFFLCWAPYNIMVLIHFVDIWTFSGARDDVITIVFPIAIGLAVLNSCLNPLLYVFMGQNFKDVFRSSVLKVMENVFAEELPQNNPGSSIYVSALSQIQAPIELLDTPASLLPPPAPTPTQDGQGFKDVFRRAVRNVLTNTFTEELHQNNPGSSIYESAVSQIQAPSELLDTTVSLLPPPASTPASTPTPTCTSITSSSTQQYSPEENTITSNIILDLPQSLPGERLFAVRTNFIKGISQASLKCLLDELLEKKVLNESELEEANGVQLRGDKARFVMDAVRNKGSAASSIMIKILCGIDPFLSEHLGLKD